MQSLDFESHVEFQSSSLPAAIANSFREWNPRCISVEGESYGDN